LKYIIQAKVGSTKVRWCGVLIALIFKINAKYKIKHKITLPLSWVKFTKINRATYRVRSYFIVYQALKASSSGINTTYISKQKTFPAEPTEHLRRAFLPIVLF